MRGWIYRDIIFSPLAIFGQVVILSWHNIFTHGSIWWGDDYIMTLYLHSWQYLVRGWLYCDIVFSLLIIFGEGVIMFWHYIFTPGNILRGWLFLYIFSPLTIFGDGVIILWHYIIIPDTILESGTGGDYIWIFSLSKFDSAVIPVFYHSYPYIHPLKLGGLKWLYSSMIPSLLLKFSVLVDMLMDFTNSLWWKKKSVKSHRKYKKGVLW